MKIDRLHLGPKCDDPAFCLLTGKCYCAWLLGVDSKLAKQGVTMYAVKDLRRLHCESRPAEQAKIAANYLVNCNGYVTKP